jgi:hypothetical protein
MIQAFVDRFIDAQDGLFVDSHPGSYGALVQTVVETISDGDYGSPDPNRIHEIDDGDYQGTLVFVIADNGYQPNTYWIAKVGYGSCSGCDTLQAIRDSGSWTDEKPSESQASDYQTLALHIVQYLKEV